MLFRKKTSTTNDENGCKRCKCKKTKCLKLSFPCSYCDCFAAGIHCSDPCSCQTCLNRQEYQDNVLEARRKIKSHNPFAFLPKVVQHTTDILSNNMEGANLTTPSSARHKRGCNCKRSMCRKKYCDCYQAKVGCSSGCRCKGCENAYGRKEG
ncbi:putative transcription factor Tesmin family [Lupinus albus]|uniref:Putative transcription factor Tesmin family n=1 Tax=Lupinus albus TaxID=3870 RepID=A0A6A4P8R0_LUPAL|nr:putative transcription factor Tesmin family [Lupinus albus]